MANALPLIALAAGAIFLLKGKGSGGNGVPESAGDDTTKIGPGTHAVKANEVLSFHIPQAYGKMTGLGPIMLDGKQANYYGSGDFDIVSDNIYGKARATWWRFTPLKKGQFTFEMTSWPDHTSDAGAQVSNFVLNVS